MGQCLLTPKKKEYLDFLSGAGTLNYGHNNPRLKQAAMAYLADDGILHGLDMATAAKEEFISTFQSKILAPRHLKYKIQFTGPTGANAVEAALKLARNYTERSGVIAFTNAFHGVTAGALAATANRKFRDAAGQQLGQVSFFPYCNYLKDQSDSLDQLEQALNDQE